MDYIIDLVKREVSPEIEIVERKGIGHPDTLADMLAERLSASYSRYTLEEFGVILHHNFDKFGLLGGESDITYGHGQIISPIRILLNGRASISFSNIDVPVYEILTNETRKFFNELFDDLIDLDKDIEFHNNLSTASSPGKIKETIGSRRNMFSPSSVEEVKGYDKLLSNDTSVGCAYSPTSIFEDEVLKIEKYLNSSRLKSSFPWIGTDIKVMGTRFKNKKSLTICVPQIAKFVSSQPDYKEKKMISKRLIEDFFENCYQDQIEIFINTRDDYEKNEVYLTASGSSIESGDEGLVGRGNRINGVITPLRPMSIEGFAGKNPLYHVGKLYNVLALNIANRIFEEYHVANEVFIVSKSGQDLLDPWKCAIKLYASGSIKTHIESIIKDECRKLPEITQQIIKGEIKLYK